MIRFLSFVLLTIMCMVAAEAQVALGVSSGSAHAGSTVTLNLNLTDPLSDPPAAVEWTLNYSTGDFSSATFAAGPAAGNKSVSCNTKAGAMTCVLSGPDATTIGSGVVATVAMAISSSTTNSSSALSLTSLDSSDAIGSSLPVSGSGGTVTISSFGLNGFSCNAVSITPPSTATCTVSLTSAAPSGGVTVALTSSPTGAVMPSSVAIPQGSTSGTFTLSAGTVTTATAVTLTASYGGASNTFGVTINPAAAAFTLSGLTVNSSSIASGQSATGTVTLTGPAPLGGAVVLLSSSNIGAASVSPSVTVGQGGTSVTFTITGGTVTAATPVTISASYSGVTKTAGVTVNPAVAAALSSLTVNPSTLTSGQSGTGTVTLTGGAPLGGAAVSLLSSNTGAAGVPASVTVSPGATSATFTVKAGNMNAATPVTLTASYSGSSMTASVMINPATQTAAALSSVSVSPSAIVSGQSGTGTVTLTGPAPSGTVVSLSSSNSNLATLPASVPVAQGSTTATFVVNAGNTGNGKGRRKGSVTISASYSGVTKTTSVVIESSSSFGKNGRR